MRPPARPRSPKCPCRSSKTNDVHHCSSIFYGDSLAARESCGVPLLANTGSAAPALSGCLLPGRFSGMSRITSCHFFKRIFSHLVLRGRSPARLQMRGCTSHCLNNRCRLLPQSQRGGCCTRMKGSSVWTIKTEKTLTRSPARWCGAGCSNGRFRSHLHKKGLFGSNHVCS